MSFSIHKKYNHCLLFIALSCLQILLPSSIVILALMAFLMSPSTFISAKGFGVLRVHREWLLPLFVIIISTLSSEINSVSISYLFNFVSMYVLVVFVISKVSIEQIAGILSGIMLISLLGASFEFIITYHADIAQLSELSFIFSDRNEFAMFLAAGLIAEVYFITSRVSARSTSRKILLVIIPIVMIGVGSRSALLSLLVAFIAYFSFLKINHRIVSWVVIFGICLLILYLLLPSNITGGLRIFNAEGSTKDSDVIRYALILAAVELFIQNPIVGIGPNMFLLKSGVFLTDLTPNLMSGLDLTTGLVTHNSYLQYFVELGVFVGAYVVYKLIRLIRKYFVLRSSVVIGRKNDLAFLFSISIVFTTSGLFLNLHSTIFFMLVIFGIERLINKISIERGRID